ncbi:MAG: PcfJ domain-containing protein [Oscillospiraceae bacterium]|nr:PcfJ domain-containing protein [Oscillospiraceae bacterium]
MIKIKDLINLMQGYSQDFKRIIINLITERFGKINKTNPDDLKKLMGLQNIYSDLKFIEKEKEAILDKTHPELYNNIHNQFAAEYLFKTGLSVFAANMYAENLSAGNGFSQVLGISRQYIHLYRKYNIDVHEHKVIQASGTWVSYDSFEKFRALKPERNDTHDIIELLELMSFEKFVNYFTKQKAMLKKKLKFLMIQYKDYISMSKSLKVDLSRKSVSFPTNIKESHNLILERFNKVKHEIEDGNMRHAKEVLYKGMNEYANESFCIVFPQLRSDFITEGQSLNHCVGSESYYKNHMEGTRMVFFVRQATEPDKPYFTMEIDMRELRIRQLYGFGDVSPSADVRKFANEFLRLLKPADNIS